MADHAQRIAHQTVREGMVNPIRLPWPPAECSPNTKVHWAVKAKAAKAYRKTCWALAVEAGAKAAESGDIWLHITFCPPKKWTHGDRDNLVARMKPGFDGLADALKVNDRRFRLAGMDILPDSKYGPCVVVEM